MKSALTICIFLVLLFSMVSFKLDRKYTELRTTYENLTFDLEECRQANYQNMLVMMQLFGTPDTVSNAPWDTLAPDSVIWDTTGTDSVNLIYSGGENEDNH